MTQGSDDADHPRPDYEQSNQGHYPQAPQSPAQPGGYPAYPQQTYAQHPGYGHPGSPQGDYPYADGPAPGSGYGYQQQPPGKGNETAGLVLGIIGLVNAVVISPFLWITGPVSLVLGWLGVWQGRKANRGGANGAPGVVMGWISLALGILYLLVILGLLVFILIAAGQYA
ncbi:DUF4190 domain-containing protein [Nesterenkonia populi]|uniref:DUF4190 domain-containing protein n=1 Tax=Nesterenkonia populi TaxID=1591087 RepID=UPI0011BEB588|nr:DUF4190 domain-containing protein [Nesterenkonia populi]